MGILSSTISITRYQVQGDLEEPVLETVTKGLEKYRIAEIDDESGEKSLGWTSTQNPFDPNFEGSSFVVGADLVFSLRIDKKTIPPKIVTKRFAIESARRLAETGRDFLTRNEKKALKDHVINTLAIRIPATPNIYDVIWRIENRELWFFTNLKSANEELESLFAKSFKLNLIRLFPYTMAELRTELSETERDMVSNLTPTQFTE